MSEPTPTREPLRFGLYRKIVGRTGIGLLYQFVNVCRHHDDGKEYVTYIPLRIEPEWGGVRHCVIERERFLEKFEWVGEGLTGSRP